MDDLLTAIKLALRITTDEFDTELTTLAYACLIDIGFAGVDTDTIGDDYLTNAAVIMLITTYCKLHFGKIDGQEYDRLKASYDEQKAQMSMADGYTVWSEDEDE